MGAYICDRCQHEHADYTRSCAICGACSVCYCPTLAEIREQCEVINGQWSDYERGKRRREPVHSVEIPDLRIGWRRVNRREYRD